MKTKKSKPHPILLDMDPGVDDALAIILALRSPEIEVKAITICGGNVGVEQCALNAVKTLDQLDLKSKPPVAMGAWRPIRRSPFRAGGIHGPDGLGDVTAKYPNPPLNAIDPRHAVDVILETIRNLPPRTLTIVATAPLTNLALAISKDSETMRQVKRIVWMGGAYETHGNITPVAEFNAFCDPDAAQEVLSFGVPMTVVGLDACMQCPLTREELKAIKTDLSSVSIFAWDICQKYMDFYYKHEEFDGCYLHDPLAVGLAIWNDLILGQGEYHVDVITEPGKAFGQTIIDRRLRYAWHNKTCKAAFDRMNSTDAAVLQEFGICGMRPHISVVLSVDAASFRRRFLKRLA